ncbi:MAG: hypothetical protein ACP5LB_07475 [Candidatus Bathyarchaeia archaeon]
MLDLYVSTLEHLRKFSLKTGNRKRVLGSIPRWNTDVICIVGAIEQQLFPPPSYMRYRREH